MLDYLEGKMRGMVSAYFTAMRSQSAQPVTPNLMLTTPLTLSYVRPRAVVFIITTLSRVSRFYHRGTVSVVSADDVEVVDTAVASTASDLGSTGTVSVMGMLAPGKVCVCVCVYVVFPSWLHPCVRRD